MSSRLLLYVNKDDNLVNNVEKNSKDGKDLHFEDTSIKKGLLVQGVNEDNIENDAIYVEGEKEVKKIIVEVEENEEDEEEMKDDTRTEEDKDEYFFHSLEEEEEAPQKVQKKT